MKKWLKGNLFKYLTLVLAILVVYQWFTIKANSQKEDSLVRQYSTNSDEMFQFLLAQIDFGSYADLLNTLSTGDIRQIRKAQDMSTNMADIVYQLYKLQNDTPTHPLNQNTDSDSLFMIKVYSARLSPELYWIEQMYYKGRSIKPEDKKLFQDISKQVNELNDELISLKEIMKQNLPNSSSNIKEQYVNIVTKYTNTMTNTINEYKKKYMS